VEEREEERQDSDERSAMTFCISVIKSEAFIVGGEIGEGTAAFVSAKEGGAYVDGFVRRHTIYR
jgi:hypothetical protein